MLAPAKERSASQLGLDFERDLKASFPKQWWVTKMKGAVPPPRFGGGFTPKVDYDLEVKIPLAAGVARPSPIGAFFAVAIECKSTSADRLQAAMLLDHQRAGLKKAQSFGALAFVALELRGADGGSMVVLLDPGAFPETGSIHRDEAMHRGVILDAWIARRWNIADVIRRHLPLGDRYSWTESA